MCCHGVCTKLVVQDSFDAADGKEPDREERVGQRKHCVVIATECLGKVCPSLYQISAGISQHVHHRNGGEDTASESVRDVHADLRQLRDLQRQKSAN